MPRKIYIVILSQPTRVIIMACYTAPAVAAIVHYLHRKKTKNNDPRQVWLNLLFMGAAVFSIVDHIWNHELLAFNWMDMLLGLTITVTIIISWSVMIYVERARSEQPATS